MIPRDSIDGATDGEPTNDERGSVATALRSSPEGNDSRVSRVVAMVMSPAAPFTMGTASSTDAREEDVVTAVDGAREALTEEQHAALARRIRLAMEQPDMEQTLRHGTSWHGTSRHGTPLPWPATPLPAPVQPSSFIAPPPQPASVPPASGERAPISFKKTMLLGLPRLSADASPGASDEPSSVASVRASVVREVGPPRTPPPRRSRRADAVYVTNATDLTEAVEADEEPPDHDAFHLDHRIVAPERVSPEAMYLEASARGSMNRQVWLGTAPAELARGGGLILPPPPGRRDLEPSSQTGHERPSSLLERFERAEWGAGSTGGYGARSGAARATPALTDLPSTDPFAGFIAPPPSVAQRWATVLVLALAVVGLFALTALVLRWLSIIAW